MNVDRSRFATLALAMSVSACGHDAPPPEPAPSPSPPPVAPVELEGEAHHDGSPQLAASLPLRTALSFEASRSDSCSQSWAVSSWQGQLVVTADAEGEAALAMSWAGQETGGGHGDPGYARTTQEGCELPGRARVEGRELVFEFAFPSREGEVWPPYECGSVGSHEEGETFVMRCAMTPIELGLARDAPPSRHLSVLGCRFGEKLPYLLFHLVDEEGVLEFADERLHVVADHDDVFAGLVRSRWLDVADEG